MTHPNPKAPGNVPLYRCVNAPTCCWKLCPQKQPHTIGPVVNCLGFAWVEVGFRTPPDCHYCIHVQSASQCAKCENKDKYTPRQPGKGGAS